MKKLFFSFVMLVTLVIVAGSAKAQTSINPYIGGTYTYSVGSLDNPSIDRRVEVYLNTSGTGSTPAYAYSGKYTVKNIKDGAQSPISPVTSDVNLISFTLPSGQAAFTFDISYDGIAAGDYDLYVKVYNGTATTDCKNYMFLDVSVKENIFDLAITPKDSPICQIVADQTSQQTAASNNQITNFVYKVDRTGGTTDYNWSFHLAVTPDKVGSSSISFSSASANVAVTGDMTSGFDVVVTNTTDLKNIEITFKVNTTTGVADAPIVAQISQQKLLYKQTNTEILTTESSTGSGNNSATVTIKRLPTIGSFSGN